MSRCGVDTVRQLYNGKLRPEVMALFDLSVDVVEFAGYEWSKGRIGLTPMALFALHTPKKPDCAPAP